MQWHKSLSPDQSGLAPTLKITLGDTPGVFSKWLMMNTPFTQKKLGLRIVQGHAWELKLPESVL